jgi:hypothetical protein
MKKPDLLLEQYYLNEKKPDGNPNEISASMDAIAKSNANILAAYPAADMKAAVRAKLSAGSATGLSGNEGTAAQSPDTAGKDSRPRVIRGNFTGWKLASSALAACLVIAVTAGVVTTTVANRGVPAGNDSAAIAMSITRAKGSGPELFVYKQEGTEAVRLESGTKVFPEDVIQLSYVAGSARYGAIISVDGRGIVTQHYPEYDGIAAMLLPRGETSLDFAYKLDNAPRFERFFFLTGNAPFSTQQFQMRLSAVAKAAPSPDFEVPDVLKGKVTITDIILLK